MLNYTFKKDDIFTTVEIELLKTPFVDIWQNYMVELSERIPKIIWYTCRLASNKRYYTGDQCIEFLARIYNSFLYFHKKQIGNYSKEIERIEYLFTKPHFLNQDDLNIWHRHFTTLEFSHSMKPHMTPPNTSIQDLYEYIHDVNQFVHRCETYTYYGCPRRQQYPNSEMYGVQFTNANHNAFLASNQNNQVWNDSTPRIEQGIFDFKKDNYDCTVWLGEDIIGKDHIKAWLDGDDLTHSDITGNDCMTPNIILDPNKLFYRVISTTEFQIESEKSGKTLDRPSIGNITNLSNINWDNILGSEVHSIELDGKVLWNYNEYKSGI